MPLRQRRYSKEEFARRGDEIYERVIKPLTKQEHRGKFVAIDIESGDWEMADEEMAASDRLIERKPDAQVWIVRIGFRHMRQIRIKGRNRVSIGGKNIWQPQSRS
jgi:hypothetical protein